MISANEKIRLYKTMLLVREFEMKINSLFAKGLVYGTTHLCVGQEASAVGTGLTLQKSDLMVGNHRSHGHVLAKGLSAGKLMAEMLGRSSGYCRGLGGSQHVACAEYGLLGTNGITCGGMPTALGAAYALKIKGTENICAVYIGDGATNQGVFHETMNMAALWSAPLLVICENNLYAMSTPLDSHLSGGLKGLKLRGESYGIRTDVVMDGLDCLEVYKAAADAVRYVRSESKPCFFIVNTYRNLGHSKSDPRVYRRREEESDYKKRDSLKGLASVLEKDGLADKREIKAWKKEVRAEIENLCSQALDDLPLSREELLALARSTGYLKECGGIQ